MRIKKPFRAANKLESHTSECAGTHLFSFNCQVLMMTSSQPRNRMQIVLPYAFCCQVEFPICHSSKPCFYSKALGKKEEDIIEKSEMVP